MVRPRATSDTPETAQGGMMIWVFSEWSSFDKRGGAKAESDATAVVEAREADMFEELRCQFRITVPELRCRITVPVY